MPSTSSRSLGNLAAHKQLTRLENDLRRGDYEITERLVWADAREELTFYGFALVLVNIAAGDGRPFSAWCRARQRGHGRRRYRNLPGCNRFNCVEPGMHDPVS